MKNKNKMPQPYAVARVLPGDEENLKFLFREIKHNDYVFVFRPEENINPLLEAMN